MDARRTGPGRRWYAAAGADLRGADLRGEDLTEADLRGADLRGACLAGMRLDAADLSGADLTGADLSGVRMTGGSLSGARLDGSRWERAAIVGTRGILDADDVVDLGGAGGLAGCAELAVAAVAGRDEPELMVEPAGKATCAAFSPDGGLLVMGVGRKVQVVDTSPWTTLRILHDHRDGVLDVAFSPDGTLFASAGYGGTAFIWDARTGERRAALATCASIAGGVAFSADGSTVTASGREGIEEVWDARSGTLRSRSAGRESSAADVLSPDGNGGARAYSEDEREWDRYAGEYGEYVTRTANFLELRGTPGGLRRYQLDAKVYALKYIAGGAVLLAALQDGTVRAWQVATGDHALFLDLEEYCNALFTSPDEQILLTRGEGGLSVWHLATKERRAVLPLAQSRLPVARYPGQLVVVFCPDGSRLVTLFEGIAQVWDTTTWELVATLDRRPGAVAVALSPGTSLLAAGYSDGTARIWDTATGRQARVLGDHDGRVTSVAFSPDGAFAATGAGAVQIWDTASWTPRVMTPERRVGEFISVAFSPDGTSLAGLGAHEEWVLAWDVASGTPTCRRFRSFVRALMYAPGGTLLAAMSDRRHGVMMRIADTADPRRHVLLVEKDCYSHMAAMPPGGRLIVTWSRREVPRVWRLPQPLPRAFARRKRKPFARLGEDGVASVAFSADSRLIFTGGIADGTVRMWDAATGAHRTTLTTGHDGPVAAIAVSADGSTIATASGNNEASQLTSPYGDGTVRVWDAGAGQTAATLAALPGGGHAAWFPDGSYRVDDSTGGLWWAIKLCRFEPGELDPYVPALRRRGEAETIGPPSPCQPG